MLAELLAAGAGLALQDKGGVDGLKVKGAVVALNVSSPDKSLMDERPCRLPAMCQIMAAFSLLVAADHFRWRPLRHPGGRRTFVGDVVI